MKTYVVHMPQGGGHATQTVQGDRVFVNGDLKFIRNVEGKQFGDVTACFAAGTWSYFKEIGAA